MGKKMLNKIVQWNRYLPSITNYGRCFLFENGLIIPNIYKHNIKQESIGTSHSCIFYKKAREKYTSLSGIHNRDRLKHL